MPDLERFEGEIVIRFEDVHKRFGSQEVLNGLSFEVRQGRTLAIMGASGTGKSVTLKHIVGLVRSDSGLVEVEGQDMSRLTKSELITLRKRMGYVFQEGALINWLSVADNVALPLSENSSFSPSEIRERVQAKLELVHIPEAAAKMPSELSGGMKKRVGLARALITEPAIVLYDEPNAGLDPEIARSINEMIREVSERLGSTAIVVEHRIPCVKRVADEVLFLDGGRALLHESTEEFFHPTLPRLIDFLGDQAD